MATKKKSTPTAKDLRKRVTTLQARVDRLEKKADRWKARATKAEAAAKKADKKVTKLTKRSQKRERTAASGPAQVVQDQPLAAAPSPSGPAGPDDGWTVAALKDEARAQGVTGFSRMSKADLLAALR